MAETVDRGASSLRRLRRSVVALLLFYFVAGSVSQKLISGVDEIFPLFGWSLFSRIPNEGGRYTIEIVGRGDARFDSPIGFFAAPEDLVRGNRSIGRKLIQSFGAALDRGRADEARRLRRLLEANHLAPDVVYELVRETYDPLEKWRTGRDRDRRGLQRFSVGSPGG